MQASAIATPVHMVNTLSHSKLKVCFASEKYSKATRSPGNKAHTEKLHKMFTSGHDSNLPVFHTHYQFNDK
jgi:hypothetical protein